MERNSQHPPPQHQRNRWSETANILLRSISETEIKRLFQVFRASSNGARNKSKSRGNSSLLPNQKTSSSTAVFVLPIEDARFRFVIPTTHSKSIGSRRYSAGLPDFAATIVEDPPRGTYRNKHHHQEQHQNGLEMECGVTGAYTNGTTPSGILSDVRSERSPAKAGLHVNFKDKGEMHVNFKDKGEIKERREKFLTAKYGNHQMSLIRKRLAVEMWLYEELKKLYETATQVNEVNSEEVEVDIDELWRWT
ncbi:hypothetical protein QE152_g3482 [Popillia japonica]|uniref:Uncharacterized protein n=1 Tax=Popillia japonica TaxID=7064 RepID=A0AAW1N454_POPJA